jgi:hypothetical protein
VRGAQATTDREEMERSFLREAAHGLAGMIPEDHEKGNLTIPLGVSTWIVRSDINLARACDAMLELRSALLEVSGLDQRSEPVPLLGSDRRTSVLTLTIYLDGLVERGARMARKTRTDIALALLGS